MDTLVISIEEYDQVAMRIAYDACAHIDIKYEDYLTAMAKVK